jgi:hypothetical protein
MSSSSSSSSSYMVSTRALNKNVKIVTCNMRNFVPCKLAITVITVTITISTVINRRVLVHPSRIILLVLVHVREQGHGGEYVSL